MARLILVRHGRAAAGWGDDADPGLDDLGRAQAAAMARALGAEPRPLFTSPLRRTRETAEALERAWGVQATVEHGVSEVVAPTPDLAERSRWLRGALAGSWSELGSSYEAWRGNVVSTLGAMRDGSVVVTHFVAINVAIGHAWGDDRVVCQPVDNCSRTTLEIDDATGEWRIIELGATAATVVN